MEGIGSGWVGARSEDVTQAQPITDLLCRKWGNGTSGDEAFPHILKTGVWLQSCLQPGVHLEGMPGVDKHVVLQG